MSDSPSASHAEAPVRSGASGVVGADAGAATPPPSRAERRAAARRELLSFCLGGVLGFVVDYGVLWLLVSGLHRDRYSARLVSFLCAVTATWLFNRNYTFKGTRNHSRFGEWWRYILAMSGGFACNYAAYSAMVAVFNFDGWRLAFALAVGSVAGLGVNFAASRYWIYRRRSL